LAETGHFRPITKFSHFLPKNARLSPLDSFGGADGIWHYCSIAKKRQISPKNARFLSDRPEHRKIVATSRLAVSGGFWRFCSIAKKRQILPKNARFRSDHPEQRKIVATSRLAVSGGFWRFCSIAKNRQILPKYARFPSDRPERRDGRFLTDGHVAVVKRAGPLSFCESSTGSVF
jgi:hypothetical protein